MHIINEYTLKTYEVYKIHVIDDEVFFVVWDDFDGWQLVNGEFYRPYKPLMG